MPVPKPVTHEGSGTIIFASLQSSFTPGPRIYLHRSTEVGGGGGGDPGGRWPQIGRAHV